MNCILKKEKRDKQRLFLFILILLVCIDCQCDKMTGVKKTKKNFFCKYILHIFAKNIYQRKISILWIQKPNIWVLS